MNELQTDEKTAIHTTLKSIRANDHDPLAQSPHSAARSRPVPVAVKPFPSSNPASAQIAVKPFPSPESQSLHSESLHGESLHGESLHNKGAELSPDLQTVIQTALQNGFPGQMNLPPDHFPQPPGSPATKLPDSATRDPLKELAEQANRINQLSRNREAALRRAQSIAAQLAQERRAIHRPVEPSLLLEPPMPRSQAERPDRLNPRSPVFSESVTLRIQVPPDAQETAAEVAQLLRQIRGHRDSSQDALPPTISVQRLYKRPSLLKRLRRWLFASASDRSSRHRKGNYSDSSHQSYSPETIATTEPVFTLQETLTLLVSAALTRLLLNLLLEVLPLLTVPVIILLILPAAIGLYKATIAPQSGILWGYRICVILFGLLIGGRL